MEGDRVKQRSRREYHARLHAEWAEFRDGIKLWLGCADCGYREHACALDFDHVRGKKRFTVGNAALRNRADALKEMAKCEVVCSNCHRVRTRDRK